MGLPIERSPIVQGGRSSHRWILWAIVVTALLLRIWGCFGKGLPYTFYKDEENNVERALQFGAKGTLDPKWFNKPALGYYIWFVEFGVYFLTGKAVGKFEDQHDFAVSYFQDPGPFFIIGRLNAAVFGALCVLLVYFLGAKVRDRTTGLIAALVLAVLLGHVGSSQEVKKDVVATFFAIASAIAVFNVAERGFRKDYVVAMFLAGLGTATKYWPAFMFAPLAVAHLVRSPAARARSPRVIFSTRMGIAFVALVVGFFVGSPYNFLNPQFYYERVLPNLRFVIGRLVPSLLQTLDVPHPGIVGSQQSVGDSFTYFFQTAVSRVSLGWPLTILGFLGILMLFRRPRTTESPEAEGLSVRTLRSSIVLLSSVIVAVATVVIPNQQFPEPRHLNFVYPFWAVLVAIGIDSLARGLSVLGGSFKKKLPPARLVLCLSLIAPVPGMPLFEVLRHNIDVNRPDPRLRVLDWIKKNIPSGSAILNDKGWLPLKPTLARTLQVLMRLDSSYKQLQMALKAHRLLPETAENRATILWMERTLAQLDNYLALWEWERRAANRFPEGRYDVLPWNHDWYSKDLNLREEQSQAYNSTWEHSPWGYLFGEVFIEAKSKGITLSPEEAKASFLTKLRRDLQTFLLEEMRREGVPEQELSARLPERFALACVEFELSEKDVSLVELWRRRSPISARWMTSKLDSEGRRDYQALEWFVSAKITYDNYVKGFRRQIFPDWADFYDDLKAHYDCFEFDAGTPDWHQVLRIWELKERKKNPRLVQVW